MIDQSKRRGLPVKGAERDIARDWVMQLRGQGLTIRQIGAQIGRSYGFVYELLTEAGEPRQRSQISGIERDELRKKVVKLYDRDELTMRQISDMTELNYHFVRRLLHEAKVQIRSRGSRGKK